MTMGLLFWILMLIWLLFGFFVHWGWPTTVPASYGITGHSLLLFILLLLLGWQTFGAPIR